MSVPRNSIESVGPIVLLVATILAVSGVVFERIEPTLKN
jgi:hypothetical protein